jgi:pimeloyl-ACP methyl ester carboxylesterase
MTKSTEAAYRDLYVSAQDGLKLYGRDYGSREASATPVVCLPGLTRHSGDFDVIARALAQHTEAPRRVLALDFRGRGLSGRDPDWRNYDVKIEVADTLAFLAAAGVGHAIFLGTSRGGLVTMALSAVRPAMIRGAILNDIGPEVDARGLIRIRSYVGKLPPPRDFEEGAELLKRISADQFTAAEESDWRFYAENTWREENGRLVLSYDTALMKGLAALDLEAPLPTLWPLFEGLTPFQILVLRGANSDLLSEATVAEMQRRHPRMQSYSIVGQGHAPLLTDKPTIERVLRFVAEVEEGAPAVAE